MTTETAARTDLEAVQAGFAAFGRGDLGAFAAGFHSDATWNHRNDDVFGGVHDGIDAILAFIEQSGRLSGGTLQAVPETAMADGQGRVAVVTRVQAQRPDGRTFDDRQILLFTVDEGRVRSVDQYIGDPAAATTFWG